MSSDIGTITLQQVEQAIHALYHEPELHAKAHQWLLQIQSHPSFWEIALSLLQSKNIEAQYFGANTLEQKIKKEWTKLPPDFRINLKTAIMELVQKFKDGPRMVLTRLCIAISAIAVYTVPEVWSNFIDEVLSLASTGLHASLELLIVMPEEIPRADYVTQDRKSAVSDVFRAGGGTVVQFLCSVIQQQSAPEALDTQKLALQCLQSWVQFDLPQSDMIFGPVLTCLLEKVVVQPGLLASVVPTIESIFVHSGKSLSKYPSVLHSMLSRLLDPAVSALLHNSVISRSPSAYDTTHVICHLFASIAEHHLKVLLSYENVLQFLGLLVECAAHPDKEISRLTLVVWCEVVAVSEEETDTTVTHDTLLRVVEILRRKCIYEDESEEYEMSEYRQEVGDTILMLYTLLGNRLVAVLGAGLQNDTNWAGREAALFLLTAVAEAFEGDSGNKGGQGITSSILWPIFQLAGTQALTPVPLGRSLLRFFAAYSRWLVSNSEGSTAVDLLRPVIQGFMGPLSTPGHPLAGVAARALSNIAEVAACVNILAPNLQSIISTTLPILHLLQHTEQLALVEAYSRIVLSLPIDSVLSPLVQISTPFFNNLQAALSVPAPTPQAILHPLALLGVIVKVVDIDAPPISTQTNINPPANQLHPLVSLMQALQPIIEVIAQRFLSVSPDIVEAIAHLYKQGLLSTRAHGYPVLRTMLSLLRVSFNSTYNGSLLQVVSVAASIFGQWELFEGDFQQFLQGVMQPSLFSNAPPEAIKEFYVVCQQYIKYCPVGVVPYVENIALASMGTISTATEKHSMRAALTVLASLAALADATSATSSSTTSQLITVATNMFSTHGYALTQLLLQGIGGTISRAQLPAVGEVIHSMVSHIPALFRQWASQLLAQQGFPSTHASKEQKDAFLTAIMQAKGKNALKNTVQEFAITARGLSEFGTKTNPLVL